MQAHYMNKPNNPSEYCFSTMNTTKEKLSHEATVQFTKISKMIVCFATIAATKDRMI